MSTQAITTSTSTTAAAGQNAQRSLLSFVTSFLIAVLSAVAFLGTAGPSFILSFIFSNMAQNKPAAVIEAGAEKKALIDASPASEQVDAVAEDEDTSERSELPSPPPQDIAPKVLKSRLIRSSTPQTPALSVSSLSSNEDVVSPIGQDETEPDYFPTSSLIDAKEGLAFVTDKAFPEPHTTGPNVSIVEIGEEEIFSAPLPVVDVVAVPVKRVAGDKPKEPKVSLYSAPVDIRPAPVEKIAVEPKKTTLRILPIALARTLSKRAKKKAKAAIKRSMSISSDAQVIEPLPSPVQEIIIAPRSPGPFLTVTRIKKFKKAYRVHHGEPLRTDDARMLMMERGWQAVKEFLGDRY
jgi:hypothetical protein